MAALTQARMSRVESLSTVDLPLAAQHVYPNGRACADTATATVKKAASGNANLISLGEFADEYDNTGGLAPRALVRLDNTIWVAWYDSVTGGGAVTAANLFNVVYWADDHTVTTSAGGNSVAGRVWKVDSVNGVAIQKTGL
jgi:hypothetical protein